MKNIEILKPIQKTIKSYRTERERIRNEYQYSAKKLYLGRSFAQLDFEFNFAKNLFIKSKFDRILVDTGISYDGSGMRPLYPDIILIKNDTLIAIIEVKIDLGWLKIDEFGIRKNKNGRYTFVSSQNNFRKRYDKFLTSKIGRYHKKVDEDNEDKIEFSIPRSVKKYFILVTTENDHGRYKEFKKSIRNSKFKLLVFLRTTHPGKRNTVWSDVAHDLNQNKRHIIKHLKRILL